MKASVLEHSDRTGRDRTVVKGLVGLTLAIGTLVGASLTGSPVTAACDTLDVPTVGIQRCVVAGDQAQIDDGNVVRLDRLSSSNVHWLGGHRTSHGGTFRALPQLEIGDEVSFRGQTYEIVEYTTAQFTNPGRVLTWTRATEETLVLQTSRDSSSAHLWRGVAVSTTSDVAAESDKSAERTVTVNVPTPRLIEVAALGATGAAVNLTVVNPAGPGYLTAYTCNTTRPTTSNLNETDQTTVRADLAIVHPDANGNICIYGSQATDVVIDTRNHGPR